MDRSRPTVSDGRTVSAVRALTTLVWRPVAAGPWPLIVFAAGFAVGPTPYEPLLRAWASAGYVVAAPEFPLTDEAVAGADLDESDIDNQPADVRFVVDALAAPGSAVRSDIERDAVLLAGHSDGAETVLAASIAPVPPGQPPIRGVACLSVAALPGRSATPTPPLLVVQGSADTTNPPERAEAAYRAARPPKWYLDLEGGGHLPPYLPASPWLPTVEATTLAFFGLLAGRDDAAAVAAAGRHPPLTAITSMTSSRP